MPPSPQSSRLPAKYTKPTHLTTYPHEADTKQNKSRILSKKNQSRKRVRHRNRITKKTKKTHSKTLNILFIDHVIDAGTPLPPTLKSTKIPNNS